MTSPNEALQARPIDSRLMRTLFYVGEGAMLGGGCYYTIYLLSLVLAGVDRWFVIIVALSLVFIGGRAMAVGRINRQFITNG